jgi:hypothetical protein
MIIENCPVQFLFSTAYLPPVSYLQSCKAADKIKVESKEHFIKQTYRNRCYIYGPNGKQALVIPVRHENLFRIPVDEVRISNVTAWNKIHWKSINSAYRNSPFFEYFEESFLEVFENPPELLFDFNMTLLKKLLHCFGIKKEILFTDVYTSIPADSKDLRGTFHPKITIENTEPYHQVFSDRHGFISDLSSIDLLFNSGK